MDVLLILAHPKQGSFNHAIAEAAMQALKQNGHKAVFHDLYLESFDPILRFEEIPKEAPLDSIIQRHCQEIALTEGVKLRRRTPQQATGHPRRRRIKIGPC
jgi:NAD(P)H dehydrogenase (quinone)